MSLMDLHVLVTRPESYASPLCDAIVARGGRAINLPTIAFAKADDAPQTVNLNQFDWLIFVSKQAVSEAIKTNMLALSHVQGQTKLASIGEGTAEMLRSFGFSKITYPQNGQWHSEGLLALAEFNQVDGKHIAIMRGVGGRELLEEILTERGARVSSIILYQRVLPKIDISPYTQLLKDNKIDIIVCTSFESIHNLKQLFGDKAWPYLKKIPLIVISERLKVLAHDLGFQTIWVSSNASNEAIINVLFCYKKG